MVPIFFRNGLRLGAATKEFGRERQTKRPFLHMKRPEFMPSPGWKIRSGANNFEQVEKPGRVITSDPWWDGDIRVREIESEKDLVESLVNAGSKLVVVQFYTPSCGGCRALHPKMHQIAKKHREVIFLNVNLEVHKLLCDTFIVPAVPFFQFYRGTQGRVHSFSCTVGTIHKMKNALKKKSNEQIGPEPEKGLDEGELLNLPSSREIEGLDEGKLLSLALSKETEGLHEGEFLNLASSKETEGLDDGKLLNLAPSMEIEVDDPVDVPNNHGDFSFVAA